MKKCSSKIIPLTNRIYGTCICDIAWQCLCNKFIELKLFSKIRWMGYTVPFHSSPYSGAFASKYTIKDCDGKTHWHYDYDICQMVKKLHSIWYFCLPYIFKQNNQHEALFFVHENDCKYKILVTQV